MLSAPPVSTKASPLPRFSSGRSRDSSGSSQTPVSRSSGGSGRGSAGSSALCAVGAAAGSSSMLAPVLRPATPLSPAVSRGPVPETPSDSSFFESDGPAGSVSSVGPVSGGRSVTRLTGLSSAVSSPGSAGTMSPVSSEASPAATDRSPVCCAATVGASDVVGPTVGRWVPPRASRTRSPASTDTEREPAPAAGLMTATPSTPSTRSEQSERRVSPSGSGMRSPGRGDAVTAPPQRRSRRGLHRGRRREHW